MIFLDCVYLEYVLTPNYSSNKLTSGSNPVSRRVGSPFSPSYLPVLPVYGGKGGPAEIIFLTGSNNLILLPVAFPYAAVHKPS